MAKNLTPMQEAFLEFLYNEAQGDIRTAMNMAGYVKTASISNMVETLADEIVERSKKLIAANTAKATLKALGILNDPTALGNEKLLAVANSLWDRAGIVKKDQVEISGNAGGVFFLPRKNED